MILCKHFGFLFVLYLTCLSELTYSATTTTTTTSFLSAAERTRLHQIFSSAVDVKDLATTYYAVLGLKSQGAAVPNEKDICKALIAAAEAGPTVEGLFHITGTWKALAKCPGALPTAKILKTLNAVLEQEGASMAELYQAVSALSSLGQKLPETAKVIKIVQAALKKDDSISSLGYSFHIGVQLTGDVTSIYNRIEDAIVQADEVDGKFLQFEGGLSITALIVSGAYRLASTVNKPPPITGEQAVKFANYFLSRRSVQVSKGAYSLLDVLNVLTTNKYHIPVVVSLVGQGVVSSEQPKVSVQVTNLLGQPLTSDPLAVTAESATRSADEVVVLSKKKFEPTSDKTVFAVNLMDAKPAPGLYKLSVSAVPSKPDARLVGNIGVLLPLKVICAVTVDNFEVGVGDSDQTTQPKFDKVVYPTKLGRVLEVDSQQKLVAKFSLKDKATGKGLQVHQAFMRFQNKATNQEIIFIAEPDGTEGGYRFDLDLGAKGADFGQLSGVYSLHLIIGDVILSNSFTWLLADVKLKLALDASQAPIVASLYEAKPEIKHLFREPERRPPTVVSNLFTGLVALPFLILLIMWAKIGVNISNFPFSLYAIGFHLGLGAIFTLFGLFWLQLNMFQTLKYLMGLGVVTFLCGNQLLARIATNRKAH